MRDKLILNDQTEIEIKSASALNDIRVLSQTKAEMVATWDKLTAGNLASVQLKNADGVTVGLYTDLVLVSETSAVQADGMILTSFNLREKTDQERLAERVAAIEAGQQAQDVQIAGMSEELTGTQIGLAETYEMIEGLAGVGA